MIRILLLLLTTIMICSLYAGKEAFSSEIVLCINNSEEYITRVGSKTDCLDDESSMTINGPVTEELEQYTPLANFITHEDCEGEGRIIEIGFDQNNNGSLDEGELYSKKSSCVTPAEDE